MIEEDSRPVVVVYGGCQAEHIAALLEGVAEIASAFRFLVVPNYAGEGESVAAPPPAGVANAAMLWQQYDEREKLPVREALLAAVPAGCPRIVFPACFLMSLWPYAAVDPRNLPEPGFPHGRFPWGDRIAMEVAASRLAADEAYSTYMRRSTEQMPDLERLLARDIDLQRRRDSICDVAIADYIGERVRTEYLFWTWGHPAPALMAEVAARLCAASESVLGRSEAAFRENAATSLANYDRVGEQLPVHPAVIDRLGLRFLTGLTRYSWMGRLWTFEEFLKRYIVFDRSW